MDITQDQRKTLRYQFLTLTDTLNNNALNPKIIAQIRSDIGQVAKNLKDNPTIEVADSAIQTLNMCKNAVKLAFTDTLTGLPNRASFNKQMQIALELNGTERQHTEHDQNRDNTGKKIYFALMMYDLDRFKSINDDYSHSTGDKGLQEMGNNIARLFTGTTRKDSDDIFGEHGRIARLGGDEFTTILYSYADSKEEAQENFKGAEARFNKAFSNKYFEYGDHKIPLVTSIGLHQLEQGDTIASAQEKADVFLEESKQTKDQRYDQTINYWKAQGVTLSPLQKKRIEETVPTTNTTIEPV